MEPIVIYRSKSGFTRQYAEWIAEELGCSCVQADSFSPEEFVNYDPIIYGGGLYAVGINGLALIKENLGMLAGKKIIVWATGASRGTQEELDHIRQENFTEEQLRLITPFYLRGGFSYGRLPAREKVLMSLLKVKLKVKQDKTADEVGLLNAYTTPENHCQRENVKALVDYARDSQSRLTYRETMVSTIS